jgi:hypothetical protein
MLMRRQIVQQLIDRGLLGLAALTSTVLNQGFDPGEAFTEQRLPRSICPGCGLRGIGMQRLAQLRGVLQRVEDVQHAVGIAQMSTLLFPNPFRSVREDRDRRSVRQSQPLPPGFPATPKLFAVFNRSEGNANFRRRQGAFVPLLRSRRLSSIPLGKQADFHFPPAFCGVHAGAVCRELNISLGFPEFLHRRLPQEDVGPRPMSLGDFADGGGRDVQSARSSSRSEEMS